MKTRRNFLSHGILRVAAVAAGLFATAGFPAFAAEAASGEPDSVAWQQAAAKVASFQQSLSSDSDPVARAIEMAGDAHPYCARAGMKALLDHWEDPRTEAALARLSDGKPKHIRDGLRTPAGEADAALQQVRARLVHRSIVINRATAVARAEAVGAYLQAHPEFTDPNRAAAHFHLAKLLADELEGGAPATGVPWLARIGFLTPEYARKHLEETLAYARSLTDAEALAQPKLIEALDALPDSRVVPLFERWAAKTTNEYQRSFLQDGLQRLRSLPTGATP